MRIPPVNYFDITSKRDRYPPQTENMSETVLFGPWPFTWVGKV